MASKTIKGGFKSYVVDDSKNTYTLAKNAVLIYGGDFVMPEIPEDPEDPFSIDLSFAYGIYEDLSSGSDFKNNVYQIDGKLTGLFGGIATYGDGTKINIGKTADVNAQLGIGIGGVDGTLSGLEELTFGTIFAAGDKAQITIAKGAEIGGLIGVTVTGKGSSVTNAGELDNAIVGMMAGSFASGLLGGGEVAKSSSSATKLTNNGSIEAGIGMVGLSDNDVVLTNGKKGEIEGLVGMVGGFLPTGDIEDLVDVGSVKMQNSGDIIAAVGMLGIFAPKMTLTNAKGGEIIAGGIGMAVMSAGAEDWPEGITSSVKITNAGVIRTTIGIDLGDLPADLLGGLAGGLMPAAILGYLGDETVVNTGKIYGDVVLGGGDDKFTMKAGLLEGKTLLGAGDDTFAFAGGQIKGKIYGGDGDDTYIITKTMPKIVELADQGIDTVRSALGYTLGENVENIILTGKKDVNATGNELANALTGNAGNNKLTGGDGADVFFFFTKGGKDTITDFALTDSDVINLSKWKAIDSFAELTAHAKEKSGDVIITAGKDVLVIEDVTLADLENADALDLIVYAV